MAEEMIEVIEVVEAEEDACEFFFRCCSVKNWKSRKLTENKSESLPVQEYKGIPDRKSHDTQVVRGPSRSVSYHHLWDLLQFNNRNWPRKQT
jgi:hypothetical protein